MLAEMSVAKDKSEPKDLVPKDVPGGSESDDAEYTEHLLVPLRFKERLEEIARSVNKQRRRVGKRKRALGWFVVAHLEDWISRTEAEIAAERLQGE